MVAASPFPRLKVLLAAIGDAPIDLDANKDFRVYLPVARNHAGPNPARTNLLMTTAGNSPFERLLGRLGD